MGILKYKNLKHLPGDSGPFALGYFKEFLSDTIGLWSRMRQKYGDVFAYKILHRGSVQLMTPTSNKRILIDEAAHVENKEAWETALSELFPNSLMLMDGKEHTYHRSIMLDAFKKPAMKGYYDIMPPIIDQTISEIRPNAINKLFPFYKLMTLQLAVKVFFGLEKSDQLLKVNEAVTNMVNASAAIPLNLPGSTFRKGIKGRQFLKNYFLSLVEERKNSPGKDLFSRLTSAENEEGESFTDHEIVDHLIFVLMAAHDTTAITLTFLSYFLAKHPEWQEKVRQEVKDYDTKLTDPTSLRSLTQLSLVIKETLRIHPPLTQVLRKLTKDMNIDGHDIPKDTVVACIMQMTQLDESIWTAPHSFDPMRFDNSRKEDKKCPFSYAPFGAGQHHCIGYAFADMQIKLVMVKLLKRFELSVDAGYEPAIRDVPLKQPLDDLPVFVREIILS